MGDSAALLLRGVKGGLPPLKNQAGVSPLFKSSCEQGARGWGRICSLASLASQMLFPHPTHALSGVSPEPPFFKGGKPPLTPRLLGIFLIAASKP